MGSIAPPWPVHESVMARLASYQGEVGSGRITECSEEERQLSHGRATATELEAALAAVGLTLKDVVQWKPRRKLLEPEVLN